MVAASSGIIEWDPNLASEPRRVTVNNCSTFLEVAKARIGRVQEQLREGKEENPASTTSC